MLKNFIGLLKLVLSNKKLINTIKENCESNSSNKNLVIPRNTFEIFSELKNKCTNLIFREIIYREEKELLKASKKYIKKLLENEKSSRELLPEEELKKCIKPILEQVASGRLISYKLVESLAILLKLLSSNFNSTLGSKLLEQAKYIIAF